MDIPKLIIEHHSMMTDRGFHDIKTREISRENHIRELHALMIGELCGEALEAHRTNNFADLIKLQTCYVEALNIEPDEAWMKLFKGGVKDSYGDEIADVILRLFDLCGYSCKKINPDYGEFYQQGWSNEGSDFLMISEQIINRDLSFVFNLLYGFCVYHNIPIEKHIVVKMAYNGTRPHKHGKEY